VERILCIGCSHRTAPVDLRERLALTARGSDELLRTLVDDGNVHEAVALSTCNRTEIYLFGEDPVESESQVLALLARASGVRPTELAGHLYSLRGADAAGHLLRVAAGLDSMVVGEAEIQGQVRHSFDTARDAGFSGPVFNRLFGAALSGGGRARQETGIGRGATSVPAVAAELAARQFGDLDGVAVVMVGAGETAGLTAQALSRRGAHLALVANRRRDRAEQLAHRFGGEAAGFDQLDEWLGTADILVASTGSPHHVLAAERIAAALAGRSGRPLLAIDLAVPRDIDPAARALASLTLYDMDDLQQMVEQGRNGRSLQAPVAERILEAELDRFARWLAVQEATPTIAALRARAEAVAAAVLAENEPRWNALGTADRERMAAMVRSIVSRMFHEPTMQLKRIAGGEDALVKVAALRELFNLDGGAGPGGKA